MDFEILRKALEQALCEKGITEYEIYYTSEASTSVETLNRELNNFSSSNSAGICLRLSVGGKLGYASTELMQEGEMSSLVTRALANAEATEKEDKVGIYSGGAEYDALPASAYTECSTSELRSAALDLASRLYATSDAVKDGTATYAMSSTAVTRLYNSHGVALECSGGANVIGAQAVVSNGESSESSFDIKRLTEDLDLTSLASDTVATATEKLGATLVETGKYNVIIDSKRMRTLLSAFASVFSAKSAQMGMSLLKGKVGEKIASDVITVTDDPMHPDAVMRTNFDAEGVPARRKSVIERGVLKTLLHNRETAMEDGVESTGNAGKSGYASPIGVRPYAFCIEPGDKTLEQLYALAGDGILITELKGLHAGANAVTGDFSIESSGFRIRDGKICEAVRSFTVAGNFFELLKSVTALSDTSELGIASSSTVFGAPAVLIPGLSVSGK